ncbi:phosphotransferase enzyme family protein [Maribacter sp. X9]|uniref:phosphotransferase enzyme family protein n=1 Tax=Maribacter sp. X9 TaxID=3402159 RepID=UPI003AF3BAA5
MEVIATNHTPAELQSLLGYFSIGIPDPTFEGLTSGLINDTYLVYSNGNPTHILQRINENIFTDVAGLMNNCSLAFAKLHAEHYTNIELVKTKEGKSYYQGPEGYWRMVSYIPKTITYDTTTNLKIAFEAGRIIGKFQILLNREDSNDYIDTIPNFHNLDLRIKQFEEALSYTSKYKLKECESSIAFVQKTVTFLKENIPAELPIRICHNDTKLNNILFSTTSEKALCLIDLDTIMRGHFLFDFGDSVRTVVNSAREDEQELSLIDFRPDFFEAFIKGLASNEHIWTAPELKSLPYGAILMPFLHGLRAITDYLNGNKYYKVSYEKQNYDRALSLFQFAKKSLGNLLFMEATIAKNFPANE